MAKVKSDTSLNRVLFDTFTTEAGLIQQNVKTAEKLGGSNIFATLSPLSLSQVPTYNSISFIYCPRGRVNTCKYTAFLAIIQERP